jgi:hypothetical protein
MSTHPHSTWFDYTANDHQPEPTAAKMATIGTLAEIVFADETGPPPPERVRWFVHEFDDFLSRVGSRSQFIVGAAMGVVNRVSPLMALRPGPLRRLSRERQVIALERLEKSPLAAALLATKAAMCLVWFEHPDTAEEIGFDGMCMKGGDQ